MGNDQENIRATKDSWTTLPLPEKNVVIPLDMTISKEEMAIIQMGKYSDFYVCQMVYVL